jgi:hypothetical protein
MSYKVEKIDDEYAIIENEKLTINTYKSRKKANEVCRGLNLGKGFGGTTPLFFTQTIDKFISSLE